MSGSDSIFGGGDFNGNPIAGIAKGFAQSLQRQKLDELANDLKERETLAKKFDEIEKDSSYDPAERDKARDYAMELRMLDPTKTRPPHFKADKALTKAGARGISAIPAWFEVTHKQVMKKGPQEPKEPTAPADPTAMQQEPPNFDELFTRLGASGGAKDLSGAGGAGGDTGFQPHSSTASPIASQMPGQSHGPPALSNSDASPTSGPPDLNLADYESSRMSPEQQAGQEAKIARIKNAVPDDLADALQIPRGTTMQGAREFRLREETSIKHSLAEANSEMLQAKTLHELASVETDKVKAAALMKNAEAHMLQAQAAMQRASNPQASSFGFPITRVDEKGNILDFVFPKTGLGGGPAATVPAPPVAGSDSTGRKTPVSEDERKSVGNIDDMLDREIPSLRSLGEAHKDWLGPIAGTAMSVGTGWTDKLPQWAYDLVTQSANLTMERIYELSGKQINEAEAKRLSDVLTKPSTPFPKWIAALNQLEAKLKAIRGTKAIAAPPPPPNVTLPPMDQRVAGKTTATINGQQMIWKGAGWAPIQK